MTDTGGMSDTAPLPGAALSNSGLLRAALTVLLGFMAGGILGLVRTATFAAAFGASADLDAFYAAQRIPEALFTLVAGGALGSSFIPVFARFMAGGDEDGAWRLASAVLTVTALASTVLAGLLLIAAPVIVPAVLVPGAAPEAAALTIRLTQIMLVTVIIFSISGLLMGILNARQHFLLPALALSFNNIGQIIGALVLVRWFGVEGLAYGAVLGALLHLGIQLPGLKGTGARLRVLASVRVAGLREVFTLMLPRVIGLGVVQINFIVNIALTSTMIDGSRTALVMAWTLLFFALGIIGQSVGTALFPSLSALAAANDYSGFRRRMIGAMRAVVFLSLPATVILLLLGEPAIDLVLGRGAWTPTDTAATAWALGFFAVGIAGHSLLEVLSRGFYALSDTITPVAIGVASIVLNIALSLIFIAVIGDPASLTRGAFGGLALANSVATLLEAVVLWVLLRRRMSQHTAPVPDHLLPGMARMLLAAGGMAGAVTVVLALLGADAPGWVRLIAGGVAGGLAYGGLALLLRIDEATTVPRLVLARLRRQ